MKALALLIGILVSMPAASKEAADESQTPFVEILGVRIERGMPESVVRASLPGFYCAEKAPGVVHSFDHCSASDGIPPDADGEVTFKDGVVHSASRNWFIPDDAGQLEVLMMLNDVLTRLTGEDHAACAKIETHSDQEPTTTSFALPRKVLTVQMHTMRGRSAVFFREYLRVNPVPDSYKTRGQKLQGTEWCAYAN